MVTKLDAIDSAEGMSSLTYEDVQYVRRQLIDGQNATHDAIDRLRQVQEENDMISRRRDELEQRLVTAEADYEDLFGRFLPRMNIVDYDPNLITRKNHSFGRERRRWRRGVYGRAEGLFKFP